MAVVEQTPYKEYIANGVTKDFSLTFDCKNQEHLIVEVNGLEPPAGSWLLVNNAVSFTNAPENGFIVSIKRKTPSLRTTNYQRYDNSFQPAAINEDFDRVWLKLQELGVTDFFLDQRVEAAKGYAKKQDEELRAYLIKEIVKQGVSLDQISNYYAYLMNRLTQIAIDKGWDASLIVDGTENQQQINKQVKFKLNLTITPFDFGALGQGQDAPVSDWMMVGTKIFKGLSSLSSIQEEYPHVSSLNDSADWAATQAFLDYIKTNRVENADWSLNAYVNKPLDFKGNNWPATRKITGQLNLNTKHTFEYFLWMHGDNLTIGGSIIFNGNQPSWSVSAGRTVKYGLILGVDGNFTNCHIEKIVGGNLADHAVLVGNNCHFTTFGMIRGALCGSGATDDGINSIVANWTSREDIPGDVNQATIITVDNLPPVRRSDSSVLRVKINGEPYDVRAINGNKLTLYPQIDHTLLEGKLTYFFGGTLHVHGSNTAQTSVMVLESILCGNHFSSTALYGTAIGSFTAEYCGCGFTVNSYGNAHIGTTIQSGYFEANSFDIIYGWGQTSHSPLQISQNIALDKNKIWSMYAFRYNNERVEEFSAAPPGVLAIGASVYNSAIELGGLEITDPIYVKTYFTDGGTVPMTLDNKLAALFLKKSMNYVLHGSGAGGNPTGLITFTMPSGFTVNGVQQISIDGSQYDSPIYVSVIRTSKTNVSAKVITKKKTIGKGPTNNRPQLNASDVGYRYYDTTLAVAGRPIDWTGTAWVDMAGAVV